MNAGVRSSNLKNRPAVAKHIMVESEEGTGLQSFENLATQLAATGPVAQAITEARAAALKPNLLDPVRVVATGSISYAAIVPGAMVDSRAVVIGDRVGLVNSGDLKINGVVVVNASGPATRALDANTGEELLNASFFVNDGATYAGWTFACIATGPITLGTTELPFRKANDQSTLNPRLTAVEDSVETLGAAVVPTERDSSAIRNQAGFGHLSADDLGVMVGGMEVRPARPGSGALKQMNRGGFGRLFMDDKGIVLGAVEVRERGDGMTSIRNRAGFGFLGVDENGLIPVDEDEIEAANLPDATPYFTGPSGVLCGVAGVPMTIYVRNLFARRTDTDDIIVTLDTGSGLMLPSSREAITIDPATIGSSAKLWARPARGPTDTRKRLSMTVAVAPKVTVGTGPAKNILCFTDSIGHRQMGKFAKDLLQAWGCQPTFIGTIEGAGTTSTTDISGPLGEWREGHGTGDATYSITDRAQIVPPGGEAAYLALAKADRREFIPWLRAARLAGDPALSGPPLYVGDTLTPDDPADVRNGYVIDFKFYQARFGLATPDVILYAYGTNNAGQDRFVDVYGGMVADDTLLIAKMRAAWPNVRITRLCPGTPREATRDPVWPRYIQAFRAIMDVKVAAAYAKLVVAPAWALENQEIGYDTTVVATDPTTGVETVSFADPIHPIDNTRRELAVIPAAYIACAMHGLF